MRKPFLKSEITFKKRFSQQKKKVISQKKRLSQDEEKVFSEKKLFYFFEIAHLKKKKRNAFLWTPEKHDRYQRPIWPTYRHNWFTTYLGMNICQMVINWAQVNALTLMKEM